MPDPYYYKAVIERIVDGDTVDVVVDLGFEVMTSQRLRLLNIDTPETWRPGSELEKEAGKLVANYLKELLEGRKVIISTKKLESDFFGRYLAEIYLSGDAEKSVNKILLEEGYALKYEGSSTDWSESKLNEIIDDLSY